MDNQEFFDLYMSDTLENLTIISQNVLRLESDPTNTTYIESIFRAAHSIKGASASMEFWEIRDVTHKLEDLFGAIRDNTIVVSSKIIDVVFNAIDCLESLHEKIVDPSLEVNTSVVNEINELLNSDSVEPVEETIKETALAAKITALSNDASSKFNTKEVNSKLVTDEVLEKIKGLDLETKKVYYIRSETEESCDYKGVRMFMLLSALSDNCEVLCSYPDSKDLESDSFKGSTLDVLLVSDKKRDDILSSVSNVLEIEVTECSDVALTSENIVSILSKNNTQVAESEGNNTDVQSSNASNSLGQASTQANTKPKANNQKINKDANLYVRVHTKTLDTLLNEQGELLLEYNRLSSVLDRGRKGELSMNEMIDILDDVGTNINKINSTQQSIIMSTRMFPLEQLFTMFPRMIRDLSSSLQKQIELVIEGQDTELDRTILEKVSDPLKHIIRNAVDHGIEMPEDRIKAGKPEKGTVTLSAKQESDSVIITVKDDGKGMDPEVLKRKAVEKGLFTQSQVDKMPNEEIFSVIFMPGFSTAKEVTEVSGRGVGMDIVRSSLSEIGGVVLIDSKLGEGTTFTVKIPLTLAISQALLVNVDKEKYIVLLNYIQEVTEVNRATDIKRIQHKDHIVIRGEKIYPLVYLRDVYGYPEKKNDVESVILISNSGREIGLVADGLIGQQDIVVKSLNKYFGGQVKYEAGITKLGDGSIPIIVDIPSVMDDF